MPPERQLASLLALVDADRERKCDAILGEARGRVTAILDEAHSEARKRIRRIFHDERERKALRIAAARARLQTRCRVAEQQRAKALLAAGWQKLPIELARFWRCDDTRQAWVQAVIESARALLPAMPWRIVHAADWPEAERGAWAEMLAHEVGVTATFIDDPLIRAGLKIAVEGNVVDGTLEGLLADRSEIGSMLLRALES